MLRLLFLLGACGQRGSVVHHVRSVRLGSVRLAFAPYGHRGAVGKRRVKALFVVKRDPSADADLGFETVGIAFEIEVFVFERPPNRSIKTLSIQRPRPSIEIPPYLTGRANWAEQRKLLGFR